MFRTERSEQLPPERVPSTYRTLPVSCSGELRTTLGMHALLGLIETASGNQNADAWAYRNLPVLVRSDESVHKQGLSMELLRQRIR